jgi:hypothetical protein
VFSDEGKHRRHSGEPEQLPHPDGLEPVAAAQLGIEGNTLLAIRPGGYVGLRADRDHLAALERYAAFLQTGHS